MCTTCGCGVGEARVAAQALSEPAGLAHDGSAPPPTAAEEAADHGARDTDGQRDEPAAGILARGDHFRDRARDESKDDPCQDSHC